MTQRERMAQGLIYDTCDKEIGERDHELYFHRNERIDWENLSDICEAKSKLPKFQP